MNELTVYFCPKGRKLSLDTPPNDQHYVIFHKPTEDGRGLELEVKHSDSENAINIEIDRDGMVVTTSRALHFRRSGQVRQITSTDGLGRAAAAGD